MALAKKRAVEENFVSLTYDVGNAVIDSLKEKCFSEMIDFSIYNLAR